MKILYRGAAIVIPVLMMLIPLSAPAQEKQDIVIGSNFNLYSRVLGDTLNISVYTPENYSESTDSFPVLYTFQSHFHHVSATAAYLDRYGRMAPEMIVVSINNHKTGNLTPTKIEGRPDSGGADTFIEAFRSDLIPYIEAHYRTSPFRMIFSGSWGGLFCVYTLFTQPDLFDACIAAVPWFSYDRDEQFILRNLPGWIKKHDFSGKFLYATCDDEQEIIPHIKRFENLLMQNNPKDLNWQVHFWPEENHGSLPYRTLFNGLRSIFSQWSTIPDEVVDRGLTGIEQYEQSLTQKYGFEIGLSITAYYAVGNKYIFQTKEYDKAVELFRFVADRNPKLPAPYAMIGRSYERMENYQAALEAYKKGIELMEAHGLHQYEYLRAYLQNVEKKIK